MGAKVDLRVHLEEKERSEFVTWSKRSRLYGSGIVRTILFSALVHVVDNNIPFGCISRHQQMAKSQLNLFVICLFRLPTVFGRVATASRMHLTFNMEARAVRWSGPRAEAFARCSAPLGLRSSLAGVANTSLLLVCTLCSGSSP